MELLGVDIIIFDSSSDCKTAAVVDNYILEGLTNLKYIRWQGKWDGFSLDSKVIDAYLMFWDEYEYLWVHRDGLIIDAVAVKREIFPAIDRGNDFIVVNTTCRDYKHLGSRRYTTCTRLFEEQFMQMTILGATIIKGVVVKDIIDNVPNERGKTYSLWQPMACFHYMANKPVKAESIVDEIWIYNVAAAKSSFLGKNTMCQWCEMWCEMIKNLPSCYDGYKQQAMFIYMTDFHPFYASNLIALRANGGLNIATIYSCQSNIKYVCRTSLAVFYLIAFMPRLLAKIINKKRDSSLFKFLSVIYYLIFGIVPGEREIIE